jgi:protein-arginine kinase activator protein McsA
MPRPRTPNAICEACLEPYHPRNQSQRFCCHDCYWQWWLQHVQPEMTQLAKEKLEALREQGMDPAHGGEVAKRRGAAVAASNRLTPRRLRSA